MTVITSHYTYKPMLMMLETTNSKMPTLESENYSAFIQVSLPLMFFTLLYGPEPCAYLVLFVICTYIITHRKGSVKKMQLIAIVALFLSATLSFIFSCIYTFLQIKGSVGDIPDPVPLGDISLFVFGSYVLAKCYKIWGAKKKIIVFPIFISIINNAGRIWWIGHQVYKFLTKNKFHPTRHAMAVCLESGIMYPLALIPALVLAFEKTVRLNTELMNAFSLIPILTQVVGIAPTFIIVRVALGISIENEGNGQNNQVLSTWEANRNIDESSQSEQPTA
ncbi:hypothetical protein K435DRAFT_809480 [Dendrothele bispora CBS 962.96]|uniref:Uncharacterized protein n=1 Tax=Dendrothele bispora (strain CBS 962.96) TaxID=1314807 RepID=A0A4S8KYJ8_DENBC|nr:hypothetical protein K435DRAFT_809480 [Dendrothele bispora CBS 962.96]